jgi:thymidylate synthase (FAD)
MRYAIPRIFMLASTKMEDGVDAFLKDLGAPDWTTDAEGAGSELAEIAGRLCYKSFGTGLNPNVTRVRKGNQNYIGNSILSQKHGSVLEHAYVTFAYLDVSRIFTHELVRHRVGTAYSQESLRFVRLDKLGFYYPKAFEIDGLKQLYRSFPEETQVALDKKTDDLLDGAIEFDGEQVWAEEQAHWLKKKTEEVVTYLEGVQKEIAKRLLLDKAGEFGMKKKVTSAMRRLAPEGLATSIVHSANHRTWRDIIERRTHASAEEEIRLVFGLVYDELSAIEPAIYQDAHVEMVEGFRQITFANNRV